MGLERRLDDLERKMEKVVPPKARPTLPIPVRPIPSDEQEQELAMIAAFCSGAPAEAGAAPAAQQIVAFDALYEQLSNGACHEPGTTCGEARRQS
jgi:hypothetical protein